MPSTDVVDAVARYYATDRRDSSAAVAAFAEARERFMAPDIEWVESFGTIHGAEEVEKKLIGSHTQLLSDMEWTTLACYRTAGADRVCVVGRFAARLPNDAKVDVGWVNVWEFRNDRAFRFIAYEEDGVFQRAMGLPDEAQFPEIMAAVVAAGQTRLGAPAEGQSSPV